MNDMEPQTLSEAIHPQTPLIISIETKVDQNEGPSSPKRRRKTRACDRCHRGGVKCAAGPVDDKCGPCHAYGSECTYNRPVKRRGPPPKHRDSEERTTPVYLPQSQQASSSAWVYRQVAPHSVIEELVAFYAAAIYPIQPYYHLPTLLRRLREEQYAHSRPFYVDLMSLCALTSARIRDGASAPTHPVTSSMTSIASELFYQAAEDSFPPNLANAPELEYKRAKSNMALLCIQYGDTRGLMRYLGDYCTLCAMDGFHQESRWPAGLSVVEIQERRRLFWATYQLDIYTSCTWGATARHRESETTVQYPAEVTTDDDITPTSLILSPPGIPAPVSWFRGWNFVSDLYRILEHAIERVRIRRNRYGGASGEDSAAGLGGPVSELFERGVGPAQADILDLVGRMYGELPEVLRSAAPLGDDEDLNRLGFQATNIIITLQTLKMVVAGSGENSIAQRCAIAGDLLDAISNVPTAYIYACSAPVLHHLAGIGHLLIPLSQGPRSRSLNQWTYLQVRNCLLSMADMLSGLEAVLSRTAGIAERLRAHIERIDGVMEEAAREREGRGVVHALRRVENNGLKDAESGKGGKAEGQGSVPRVGSRATRSTTAPTHVPQNASAGPSSLNGVSADPTTQNDGRFDLEAIDFDAFAPAHQPIPDHLIDPSLLASLAEAAAFPVDTTAGVAGPNGGEGAVQPADDLFADWPFILGNAFEFLGSE